MHDRMLSTLRIKLLTAFVLVTVVTVALTTAGTIWLLKDREEAAACDRLVQFGSAVQEQIESRAGAGWRPDTLSNYLQQRSEELDLRFLLVNNQGIIVNDTDAGRLRDRPVSEVTSGRHTGACKASGFSFWQGQVIFDYRARAARLVGQDYNVLMLVPAGDISGAWHALLPRMAIATGIALLAATLVAYILARSILRPVTVLTRASEEMAHGNYDQRIAVSGHDELAMLARTFNNMAQQVSSSHRAMRDLIGNVAHELKTPLTSIQGYSNALIDKIVQTPEEEEHAARVINEEAERMRRLVEDLLYLSRLESGQLKLASDPVRIPALLETAAERVAWEVRERGRKLRLQLPVELPTVQGDEHRLEQVIANLLGNAIRHTPQGGEITLSARWATDGVLICIHNTGSYIPPEHLERIFERFYQVDPSRTRGGHQGGLGLAIAREIVAAHGGTLTASSDPATGTEFQVLLPAGRSRADDLSRKTPVPFARPVLPGSRGEQATPSS